MDGVLGFARAFDYWYARFLEEKAIPRYRSNIVARINPFIRPIDCFRLDARESAERIVDDYVRRNFVTASGWALEELATAASPNAQKSMAVGVDLQKFQTGSNDHHFYVLKSGPITRNSDILDALKRNARDAESRVRQRRGTGSVTANYVVMYGKLTTTHKDGVRRPSSAQFWAEILDLPVPDAIGLLTAMAEEAPRHMRNDAVKRHVSALKVLVADYIAERDSGQVDWKFIAKRNMLPKKEWSAEDRDRHLRALQGLEIQGFKDLTCAADSEDTERSPLVGGEVQGPNDQH